jgi:anti-sigma regulatory factor (Ser/Thr protein kinase)/anti-anti-sigma regulatory factor
MPVETSKSKLISVPADLDDDSLSGFFDELRLVMADKPAEIALDCSLLDHATSRHINALWDALTRCERAGIGMRLTAVGYGLKRVLSVLDLLELFRVEFEDESKDRLHRPPATDGRPERFEAEIEASIDSLSDIMEDLQAFFEGFGLSEIGVFDLETVFYEVATNICRHSGLEKHRRIKFAANIDANEVSFEFIDAGERFDPTGNTPEFDPRRAIKRRQSRGIGLVMIQRLMDSVSYERVDHKYNVVTLRKRLPPCVEVIE